MLTAILLPNPVQQGSQRLSLRIRPRLRKDVSSGTNRQAYPPKNHRRLIYANFFINGLLSRLNGGETFEVTSLRQVIQLRFDWSS